MRVLALSVVGALALSTIAASALAQSIVQPPSAPDGSVMQRSDDAFGMATASQFTRGAERVQLARKAARLINVGQCGKASALVESRNDKAMARRVAEVCATPANS